MPKLAPLKPNEVIRKLRALGYNGPIPGGRHVHMVHQVSQKSFRFLHPAIKMWGWACCVRSFVIRESALTNGKNFKPSLLASP